MAKILATLLAGLLLGLLVAWWWLGGSPRTLAQPSDHLVAWVEIASSEKLPVNAGGTTWIIGCTVHLRNITETATSVTVPAQRFLLILENGSTIVGHLAEPTTTRVGAQQTASVQLPRVSFFSRSQEAASVILALDEGDGLSLVAAPVGDAPPKDKQDKQDKPEPESKPEPKPESK